MPGSFRLCHDLNSRHDGLNKDKQPGSPDWIDWVTGLVPGDALGADKGWTCGDSRAVTG